MEKIKAHIESEIRRRMAERMGRHICPYCKEEFLQESDLELHRRYSDCGKCVGCKEKDERIKQLKDALRDSRYLISSTYHFLCQIYSDPESRKDIQTIADLEKALSQEDIDVD